MNREITRYIADFVRPLAGRIRMMLARGVVRLVNDAGGMQVLQLGLLAGETKDGVEYFQPYGFTFNPHPGAETAVAFIGGNRDHPIALCVADRRYRIAGLETGEVAIYTDEDSEAHQHRIILRRDGMIDIAGNDIRVNAAGVLRLEGDGVEIHGRTYVQQDVAGKGSRETFAGGTVYNSDSYTTGATGSGTEHGLDQPHIPSDHPEGP